MGIIEEGGKIWNKENLFDEYFANIIPAILPNGIILKTVDSISDENGVAIIQIGDAEGKNGEYDNNYVWIFKFTNSSSIISLGHDNPQGLYYDKINNLNKKVRNKKIKIGCLTELLEQILWYEIP